MNKVIAVSANTDFSLDLRFSDGSTKRFDVKPYLDRGIFTELKNVDYLKQARVAFGTVQWPNDSPQIQHSTSATRRYSCTVAMAI